MSTEDNERFLMVKNQIESRGIKNKALLSALEKVPRHLFVPPLYRSLAYTDQALPSCFGQTISQPYIVAKMTELLALDKKHKVLEIGTGTGYQTAVLAELAGEVYTIEIIQELYELAKLNPALQHYHNIHFICGNGYEGYQQAAPYDAIIVTAAPPCIPEKLVEQLSFDGRMAIPIGSFHQVLYLLTKDSDGEIIETPIFQVVFVPMKKK